MTDVENGAVSAGPENLNAALSAFLDAVIAVVRERGRKSGPGWVAESADVIEAGVNAMRWELVSADLNPDEDDPASMAAFAVLEAEMLYVASCHRDLLSGESLATAQAAAPRFQNETADAGSDRSVHNIQVVAGSVGRLMKHLPKWLQTVLDVLLEALQITRGVV